MSHREQALVDQHRAWRARIDATPERPWRPAEPESVGPREDRLAAAKARRAERLAAPLRTPAPELKDHSEPPVFQRVIRYETVITKEDAEFAAWKRSRYYAARRGSARASRSRR